MKVRNIYSKFLLYFFIVSANSLTYAQISIVGDDYKKELWKSINPSNNKPLTLPGSVNIKPNKLIEKETPLDNKYIKSYLNYKYKGLDHLVEITEAKYKLNPNLTKYSGIAPLNRLPEGSTQTVYMGGHFYIVSTAGTLVVPTGLNLGGGGSKKLSEKSKNILINVFGKEIE